LREIVLLMALLEVGGFADQRWVPVLDCLAVDDPPHVEPGRCVPTLWVFRVFDPARIGDDMNVSVERVAADQFGVT